MISYSESSEKAGRLNVSYHAPPLKWTMFFFESPSHGTELESVSVHKKERHMNIRTRLLENRNLTNRMDDLNTYNTEIKPIEFRISHSNVRAWSGGLILAMLTRPPEAKQNHACGLALYKTGDIATP